LQSNAIRVTFANVSWLAFSYTLPTKGKSSSRVNLWRRLQHLGALDLTGVYVLPKNPETLESVTWLAQEVKAVMGLATLMNVESFHTIKDKDLIETFKRERNKDYQVLLSELELYQKTESKTTKALAKFKRQFEDIARVDFFNAPLKTQVAKMLEALEQPKNTAINIKIVKKQEYQGKIWMTRPKPYIDRLASMWLIRSFVDAKAVFTYAQKTNPNQLSFDMPHATFGHTGNLCTFETLLYSFEIKDSTAQKMALIIHELDVQDNYYSQPESFGIEAILKGWLKQKLSDRELEDRGLQLFQGLYQHLKEK
jgi:hypothetical protein